MKKKREDLFIDELKTQIEFALISIEGVNKFLTALDTGFPKEKETELFWYNAQNLIVYSGNISKILWGIYKKGEAYQNINRLRRAERKELRNKLNVNEQSVLKNRFLRNALEHIDEKLEDFTENDQFSVLNKNIGPVRNMIQYGDEIYDISKEKNLRHYDQNKKIFYFYGEHVNLEKLYKDIKALKISIEEYEGDKDDFYR